MRLIYRVNKETSTTEIVAAEPDPDPAKEQTNTKDDSSGETAEQDATHNEHKPSSKGSKLSSSPQQSSS